MYDPLTELGLFGKNDISTYICTLSTAVGKGVVTYGGTYETGLRLQGNACILSKGEELQLLSFALLRRKGRYGQI